MVPQAEAGHTASAAVGEREPARLHQQPPQAARIATPATADHDQRAFAAELL